jgi:kinesin family protein 2/24
MESETKIKVAIRKRPLTKEELRSTTDIIEVISPKGLFLKEERKKVDLTKYVEEHAFKFDAVFDENQTNEDIYKELVKPLVKYAFGRKKISCFAYGQTGSGKTFTMLGDKGENKGLYLLAAEDIFYLLDQQQGNLRVGVSFYDIYCGKAYDLLNTRAKCPIRVDKKENVQIVGLTEKFISNAESLINLINLGLDSRITGKTGMNNSSSRSHAVLVINLRNTADFKVHGKLTFIDLAGSERGADVKDTDKQTRIDGAEINKSLLALKECIRALDLEKKHLPFRGSKLTLVLKDSFVGKSCAVMIGNISPALDSCEHTLNTLRYADRVKELKGDKKKQKSLADELMLARNNKNTVLKEGPKPKVDNHIVFEEFDTYVKKNNPTNNKESKIYEKDENHKDSSKRQSKKTSDSRNNYSSEKKNNFNIIQNKSEIISQINKIDGSDKSLKNKIVDADDFFNPHRNNILSEDPKKNNFSQNGSKKTFLKNPQMKSEKNIDSETKPSIFNYKKKNVPPIFKNDVETESQFENTKTKKNNNFLKMPGKMVMNLKPHSTQESNNITHKNNTFKNKSYLINKIEKKYEKMENIPDFDKDRLIRKYSKFIDEVVGFVKSDMRNIETFKKEVDFERSYKKIIKNLEKNIHVVNKFKKEILNTSEIIENNKKSENQDDDGFCLNNDDSLLI